MNCGEQCQDGEAVVEKAQEENAVEAFGEDQEGEDVGWYLHVEISVCHTSNPYIEDKEVPLYLCHPIATHDHTQCDQIDNHEDTLGAKDVGPLIGDTV